MQQSPRLYASPHASPLRVAALPPEGVNLPWGGPAEDCQPPRWSRSVRPELVDGGFEVFARRLKLLLCHFLKPLPPYRFSRSCRGSPVWRGNC